MTPRFSVWLCLAASLICVLLAGPASRWVTDWLGGGESIYFLQLAAWLVAATLLALSAFFQVDIRRRITR